MFRFFCSLLPMSASSSADDPLPCRRLDWRPLLLLPAILLAGAWMAGDLPIWVSLTVAGLGMGCILFMVASGLSLVFGLMGVMNFAHGMLMTLGAVAGALVLYSGAIPVLRLWLALDHPLYNAAAIVIMALCSMAISVVVGLVLERLLIRPARKDLLKQVMLTATGGAVLYELLQAMVGRGVGFFASPSLSGALLFGDIAIEKMRLLLIVIGLVTWAGLWLLLNRTRFGLLVRAAVENSEMVEAMGYRAEHLFIAMFALSVAMAALGGLMLGMQQSSVPLSLGNRLLPQIFMVLMIAGLGSMSGTLLAAVLVSLLSNYIGFAYPLFTAFSSIALTMAVVLWRPQGLYPVHSS